MEQINVRDVITTEVTTLKRNEKLTLADDLMHLGRIRHLPVLDDDGEQLVGIVSQLQQQCSDPVALVFVEHGECDLGARRTFTPDIPPDANEALAGAVPERRSESHVIDEIEFGKPMKIIIV
jgi:hypothetical protein